MFNEQKVTKKQVLKLLNKFDKGLVLECLQSKKVSGGRALIPVMKEIK